MLYFRIVPAAVIASILFLYTGNVLGQLQVEDVMTKEEQKKTGISKLNPDQKKEFETWLNQKFVLKSTPVSLANVYVSENLDSGSRLRLSDGSLYEVAPADIQYSAGWLLPFGVQLDKTQDLNYPYILTNPNSNQSVRAKQLEGPTMNPEESQKADGEKRG